MNTVDDLPDDLLQTLDLPDLRGKILHVGSSGEASGHAIDAFAKCNAYYALHYRLKVDAVDPNQQVQPSSSFDARILGSLGHQGLGLHYRRMMAVQRGTDVNEWAKPYDGMVRMARQHGAYYVELVPKAMLGVLAYLRKHAGEVFEIVGVEQKVDFAPLVGRPHTRSIDLVTKDYRTGLISFLDHKFTGRPIEAFIAGLTLDGQFLDYQVYGNAALEGRWSVANPGGKFGGAWVNVLRWGNEKYPATVGRHEIAPAPWAVSCRMDDLHEQYDRRDRLESRDPWHWPRVGDGSICAQWSGCECAHACRLGPIASKQHSPFRT